MARRLRFLLLTTAAVAAAVVLFLLVTLPPAPEHLPGLGDAPLERRTVAGAFHIHTTRSDGTADKASVAAAAARAGLAFALFTDHGDGTRPPDPPAYVHGVLCIDGVEISTGSGHYVALGMPASPYPLGGDAAGVVEDVARLGGFGIAAHPDSPKPALRWRDANAPIDGLEWLNADSEWRDEARAPLVLALAHYLVRPAAALASVLDRPGMTLARWDAMTRTRAVVAVAGHDAHGGIGGAVEDGGERAWVARVPSYEAAFRSMSTRVILDEPLTGHAPVDADRVLSALRRGRAFTAIDAVAAPAALDFTIRVAGRGLAMGESAVFGPDAVAMARASAPAGARTVLFRDGTEIAAVQGARLEHPLDTPGAYRVEVRAPQAPGTPSVPWVVSNPIYLRAAAAPDPAVGAGRPRVVLRLDSVAWRAEHDPGSNARVSSPDEAIRLEYQLRGGERASQFAALAADLPPEAPPFDAVLFTGRASGPMRVSVQLRFGGGDDDRWVRSVYLGSEARPAVVAVEKMHPVASGAALRPDAPRPTALLFVVDLTNAPPGASGWFSISRPALARAP